MESQINAAARALAAGNPLAALDRVALREDPPALALRGIAMAQLGELPRARELLHDAARRFGRSEPLAWARCVTAQTEVALALRELGASQSALDEAIAVLDRHGDRINATHARLLRVRRYLLLGRCDAAEQESAQIDLRGTAPMHAAIGQLIAGDLAVRRADATGAQRAFDAAHRAAARAGIAALLVEVDAARRRLDEPAARVRRQGTAEPVRLDAVQRLMASPTLIVDACRRAVTRGDRRCSLAKRPVLFQLAEALADGWPDGVPREVLVDRVFEASTDNASWRARLRVEVGRLRRALGDLATLEATARGFVMRPADADAVVVLAPPVDGDNAALQALLSDGAPWSTSALALALGVSQRTAQRALASLAEAGRVRSLGRGRAQRWLAPPASGYTTALLLPVVSPAG